jgi:hypothetical protein
MIKVKRWLSMLLILVTLSIALSPLRTYARTAGGMAPGDGSSATPAEASDVPQPLPHDCDGVAPSDPDACCMYGYIYWNDAPVAGADVQIASSQGVISVFTVNGGGASEAHYGADLSAEPLLASPGDVISITASYNGMVSARAWTVQSGGQQVDLGLIDGYQAALQSAD